MLILLAGLLWLVINIVIVIVLCVLFVPMILAALHVADIIKCRRASGKKLKEQVGCTLREARRIRRSGVIDGFHFDTRAHK
mgnify:CR=1 FL=1